MFELAGIIRKLLDGNAKIEYTQLPIDDPKRRKPDIRKAMSKFGWKPRVLLSEGLNKTVEYYKSLNSRKT